jgi:threonine dehydratase
MINLDAFESARSRICRFVLPTPMLKSSVLTSRSSVPVHLKLEHHQITGSFKVRGATNALLQLHDEARARGVVTVSTGNHGRGLAHAAKQLNVRAVVCMSRLVPQNKIEEIEALGAEIRVIGKSQDEAMDEAERLASSEGMTMMQPFDDPDIIAGQGTIGLEIVEAMPDLDTVLIPLSGGGLAAGVGGAIRALRPNAKIIGITMKRGAAMKASFDAGKPVRVEEFPSLADSLGGGIGLNNKYSFAMCRQVLDEIVLLEESEIAEGIRHAYEREREVVEGAGAVGIGALLAEKVKVSGPVAVVISGRNIDMELHRKIVNGLNQLPQG